MGRVMERREAMLSIRRIREEVDDHTTTLDDERATYVRHGYLLACELIERALREAAASEPKAS